MATAVEFSNIAESRIGSHPTAASSDNHESNLSNLSSPQVQREQRVEEEDHESQGEANNDGLAASGPGGSSVNHDDNRNTTAVAFDEMALEQANLEELESGNKKKVPRKIIHFVNGDTLEEYSTDEEEEGTTLEPQINPAELDWLRWFWYWLVLSATKTLAGADFLGEKLAWFFGITTPKYQYVIDEYLKMKEEEEEEKRIEAEEAEAALSEISTGQGHVDKQTDVDEMADGKMLEETADTRLKE